MRPFLFLVIGFSITNILVFLHAFEWFRWLVSGLSDRRFELAVTRKRGEGLIGFRNRYLGRLVRCHACMGFWVGAFLSWTMGGFIIEYMDVPFYKDVIGSGFLVSGVNFCAWTILRKLGVEEL